MEWQTIETCPEEGFFLVYEDGAMRAMLRYKGRWEQPDIPVLIDKVGNHIVPRELEQLRGEKLVISGGVYEPTHWMPLPTPPG